MDVLNYIGKFHPLILHLPIGFLLLAFMMELYDRWRKSKQFQSAIGFALFWGMVGAIVASVSGYLLSRGSGGYDEELLSWHKWLGIGVAVLSIVLYFLHLRTINGTNKLFFPLFGLTILLLSAAGHYGGSITHGADFLSPSTSAVKVQKEINDIENAGIFADLIQPILDTKCVSCHRSSKTKGELLMSTIEGINAGGESGALFVKGDAANSLMLKRIHLPLEDEEHMPPKGKQQLSDDEIDLIAWWINEGAKYDAKVKEVTKEEDIVSILKKYETPEGLEGLGIEPIEESKLTSIKKKGILINRVSAESPFVEVDLSNRKTVDKRTLKTLNAVSDHLISLDISSTDVQDSDLTVLSDFPHLRKLYLQKTNVTDQVIEYIKDLEYLEYLNLYETNITDDAFTYLKELEQLKSLYLWQTDVSSKGIAQHLNDRPNLIINNGIDPSLFGYSQLKPPTLVSEAKIIVDSIKVELEMNLKATKIYYTLDGSNPDSTSTLYDEPIWLSKSSTIKAMAQKEGWKTSEVTSQSFSVSKYIPELITLKSQPHEKYAASGASSLKDLRKGSTKFRDGDWLGFEKDHVVATLDLGKEVPISSVTVGALEATGSYIFYPKGIEVAISDNGTSFKKVAGTSYDAPKASRSPETSEFKELFPTETTRYVRVRIESNLVNPDWHIDPGAPCWVFIDEILIE